MRRRKGNCNQGISCGEKLFSVKEKKKHVLEISVEMCLSIYVVIQWAHEQIGRNEICDLSGIDRDTLGKADLKNINA